MSLVTLTANLPPFARGTEDRLLVAAFDDAKSLNGGVLIRSPLYGIDGEVYAVAAGPVSTGGFSFSGNAASVTNNHPTSGRIAAGATVECEVPFRIGRVGFREVVAAATGLCHRAPHRSAELTACILARHSPWMRPRLKSWCPPRNEVTSCDLWTPCSRFPYNRTYRRGS